MMRCFLFWGAGRQCVLFDILCLADLETLISIHFILIFLLVSVCLYAPPFYMQWWCAGML